MGKNKQQSNAKRPKFNFVTILVNNLKNNLINLFQIDWSLISLADITIKLGEIQNGVENVCVQNDIIRPIKAVINGKPGVKFQDFKVVGSLDKSEFLEEFSEEQKQNKVVKKKEEGDEIEPDLNEMQPENEPVYMLNKISTDTYR